MPRTSLGSLKRLFLSIINPRVITNVSVCNLNSHGTKGDLVRVRYKTYKKDFDHSYTLGVFPTLELLCARPEDVREVLLSQKGVSNSGVRKIGELCRKLGVPCSVDNKAINRLSPREDCYAIGVFRKYRLTLDSGGNHLVLVNPSGMGNLGTIMRTMVAFGVGDLALVKPCADAFDPKVVRASMGALFRLRFQYFDSFQEYSRMYADLRKTFVFMVDGDRLLTQVSVAGGPFTLVFGNESSGLDETFREAGITVAIPQSGEVDSLNLSVSVGVGLYHFAALLNT